MYDSPPAANHFNPNLYITPARRTTEHHCNAERKRQPFLNLSDNDLAPLCRNLFPSPQYQSKDYTQSVNAKLLR